MTRAPENLLAVRTLLLAHLQPYGLEPAEVGIVGDPAHRGGYHCGSDRVVTNDYSVVESSRDRIGLSAYASGLDAGTFFYGPHNLRTFSVWCAGQCAAGAPDTRDIREIIYSPDGRTVKRWDRLKRRSSGDDSHLWHTHFSFFRDAAKDGRDLTALFRRYLDTIGLTKGAAELFCKKGDTGENVKALQTKLNALGAGLTVDGDYGDATTAAVREHIGGDGTLYVGIHDGRLAIALAKRYAVQPVPAPSAPVDVEATAQRAVTLLVQRLAQ